MVPRGGQEGAPGTLLLARKPTVTDNYSTTKPTMTPFTSGFTRGNWRRLCARARPH